MQQATMLGREAIVVGSGMAGLAAARVLSDRFEHVTVLERDALDGSGGARAGVAQGKHLHALLAGGQRALDALFPGFSGDLDDVGAIRLQVGLDLRIERPGFDPFPQRDLGFYSSGLTRPQMELCVRRRVEAIPNVRIDAGCRVLELLTSVGAKAIRGARFQREGRSETRDADLVVDASGTGDVTLAALLATGHPAPTETTIGVHVGYSSAVFAIPAGAPTSWKGLMHLPAAPATSRAALMMPVEGNRWMVALGGRSGEIPPGDEAGFREFAETLRTTTLADTLRPARMIAGVDRYRFPESRLRHFERLDAFPRGLLPIGDAICRFNPVFGQGISVAAIEAGALAETLAEAAAGAGLERMWRGFFDRIAGIVEAPWALSAVPDFVFPTTVGVRPPDFETSLRFGVALARAMAVHEDIHRLAAEVQHLTRPRSALMDPSVAPRILAEMR